MPSPKGDPTYIKNKEKYFMDIAKAVGVASTHPKAPGGCVIVRDREIVGDGRSVYTHSKVEIDCLTYAIACASKNGTPLTGLLSIQLATRSPLLFFSATSWVYARLLSWRTSGSRSTKMSSAELHV